MITSAGFLLGSNSDLLDKTAINFPISEEKKRFPSKNGHKTKLKDRKPKKYIFGPSHNLVLTLTMS